jgi:glycine cleavage system H protein
MYPKEFHYTKEHEWIKIEGEEAVIGITEFAQKHLGDIIYVELPEIGKSLDVHQAIGVIESVKSVSDVYAPLAGQVTAVNTELNQAADLVNKDPHGKGWIVKIKIGNKSGLGDLMSVSEYEKYLEGLEA